MPRHRSADALLCEPPGSTRPSGGSVGLAPAVDGEIWHEYLDRFDYFEPQGIRPGCEPRIIAGGGDDVVVLVHGLTDSPWFMNAIGRRLATLGFDVLLPLLHMHGLKEPRGMRGVSVDEWKNNVGFAVDRARARGKRVSIGGLSTGGALGVHRALTDESSIDGNVFLFSPALDIAGEFGDFLEKLARSPVANVIDFFQGWGSDLIGENPYRYSRMDTGAAQELAELIAQVDYLTGARGDAISQPVFIAHSECDEAADIDGARGFVGKCDPIRSRFFTIEASLGVPHASVVLEAPVRALDGRTLEQRNPVFEDMMAAVAEFVGTNRD